MERTRTLGYAAGRYLHFSRRVTAQLAMLCLVLALLVMTAGGRTKSPADAAHAPTTQAPAQALVSNLEDQRWEKLGLFLARASAPAHRISMSSVVPLSTEAGRACHAPDVSMVVQPGDTLGWIAARYSTTWPVLAMYNHLSDPNLLFPRQTLCVPTSFSPRARRMNAPTPLVSNTPTVGQANLFPYGQCTWWANQRYYQFHGVYVPWTINSDAWQWTARAHDFGWQVSSIPRPDDIIDLQPWVQGAYRLGHVAVVERILSNGDVIASNMNWGATPGMVVDVEFTPGAGVTFIRL